MKHPRDLGMVGKPMRHRQRAALMLREANGQRAQAARGEERIVGADALAERAAGLVERLPMAFVRGDRAEHHVRMTDDIFGAGDNREIDPGRDRGKQQGRRPGVVDQCRQLARLGDRTDRGDVLDLERQRSRAFHEDRARVRADQSFDLGTDQRVIIDGFDLIAFEQGVAEVASRAVGAVDHQQLIAGPQHRQQGAGDRGHAGGIEAGSRRARLELGQRFGERPGRRGAAAPIVKRPVAPGAGGVQVGDAVEQDRRRAVHRRADDPLRPFLAATGLDDLGFRAFSLVAHHSPMPMDPAGEHPLSHCAMQQPHLDPWS